MYIYMYMQCNMVNHYKASDPAQLLMTGTTSQQLEMTAAVFFLFVISSSNIL